MKRSLQKKLIFSYLVVAMITVLVVSALIRLNSGQSLMNLVREQQTALLKESAQDYYAIYGNLDDFFSTYMKKGRPQIQSELPQSTNNKIIESSDPNGSNEFPRKTDFRGVIGLVDTDYKAIFPIRDIQIGETVSGDLFKDFIPVEVDGVIIAYIIPDTGFQFNLSAEEMLFLQRTNLAIGLAALAGVLASFVFGILFSGRIIKPIQRLTQASKGLASGDLNQQIPVSSEDELGLLTTTFNQMSADLVLADEQRKRMTADITHDLGTPLQIISGYIEMLESGEVTLNQERIEILKTEIGHLRRLVGDLTTLTQIETGGFEINPQPVQPRILMEHTYATYHPIAAKQGVEIQLELDENSPQILVDEGRILQVLKNLMENALRYTKEGGKIYLMVLLSDQVELRVKDNGAGIDPEDLPYVFERFYRADKARSTNVGKMGLGLAICKALVTAQGGEIFVESAGKGQGITMIIKFKPYWE